MDYDALLAHVIALLQQEKGRFELEPVELPDEPAGLKPGLYAQSRAFLDDRADPRLCRLDEARHHYRLAETILGYS